VAMGAAIQAGIIQGADVGAVLVDVTPHTFGVRCLGERNGLPYPYCFSPIIHKNTPLPASRTEVYYTVFEDQERVDVEVFQGDDPDALRNVRIGCFRVEGLSKAPVCSPITCHLDLDLNGMLKVTAREKKTGLEKQIVIDNAMSRFEDTEMAAAARRLRVLFGAEESQEEESESLSAEEAAAEPALDVLRRARAMLPEIPPEDRDEVIGLIERIDDAMKNGDGDQARDTARELEEILFFLEESR